MELRPASHEESSAFGRAVMAGFHEELSAADRERYERIHEPERSLAWFDRGHIVATTSAFTRELTVPGAVSSCAAVTAVTVRATHRRRGLLTAMMRRQLDDLRERGDAVAALWASEGSIYGRFGYGVAAPTARLVARRPASRLARAPAPDEPLRAGPAGDYVEAMRAIHEAVRPQRAGMLDRPGPWWRERLHDRHGAQPLQAVITGDGYALYAVRAGSDEDGPAGEVEVRELVATSPESRARLWGFLIDQDLTRTIRWDLAPLDEPLRLMLTDPKGAVRMTMTDGLWLRLVDVAAALTARSYAHDPDVVIEVADGFCPWNEGRFRLAGGGCERTEAPADLRLGVADLGVAYLGGTTLRSLAAAGRVDELTRGALARASAAFRGEVEPWCPEMF